MTKFSHSPSGTVSPMGPKPTSQNSRLPARSLSFAQCDFEIRDACLSPLAKSPIFSPDDGWGLDWDSRFNDAGYEMALKVQLSLLDCFEVAIAARETPFTQRYKAAIIFSIGSPLLTIWLADDKQSLAAAQTLSRLAALFSSSMESTVIPSLERLTKLKPSVLQQLLAAIQGEGDMAINGL